MIVLLVGLAEDVMQARVLFQNVLVEESGNVVSMSLEDWDGCFDELYLFPRESHDCRCLSQEWRSRGPIIMMQLAAEEKLHPEAMSCE